MKKFTSNSQKIGELGEDVACTFLMKHNFQIIERNYTKKWGELDIIAQKEGKLHFVEVKSKSVGSLDYVNYETSGPAENVHFWKIKRLRRVIETYLIGKREGGVEWQFDILVVFLDLERRKARVKTIENVIL